MSDRKFIIPEYGPFAGMRVVCSGSLVAMPFAATMLADFGAEVIQIERPGVGDTLRMLAPFADASTTFSQINGNIVFSSFIGNAESHNKLFEGELPEPTVCLLSTSTTTTDSTTTNSTTTDSTTTASTTTDSTTTASITLRCSSQLSVGDSPVVPTGTIPATRPFTCISTSSRNAFQSTPPFTNGVTNAVYTPLNSIIFTAPSLFRHGTARGGFR